MISRMKLEGAASGVVTVPAYDKDIFLGAGTQYALAFHSPAGTSNRTALAYSTNGLYPAGQLWCRLDTNTDWEPVVLFDLATNIVSTNAVTTTVITTNVIATNLSAAFSVSIVPSSPEVRISLPLSGEVIPYGENVRFRAELNLPTISTLYRVRFLDNDQEIDSLFNPPHRSPPYEILWTATNSGPHVLRVRVDDTFGRPFRSEQHLVTVSPAPPPTPARSSTTSPTSLAATRARRSAT